MVKKKVHKRSTLCKRLKSRRRARKSRAVRKIKKDISDLTDIFKYIDINPLEDILERLLIDKEGKGCD